MNFLNKLERKYGRYAIKNLMKYIIILYIVGWGIALVNPIFYDSVLALDVPAILHGQVWRLITFIIMPPGNDLSLFVVFSLYLYYSAKNYLYQYTKKTIYLYKYCALRE